VQSVALDPHSKKVTVPVGVPPIPFPVTVTLSVFEPPRAIEELCGEDFVDEEACPTVKHSPAEPSIDPV
jgi:hypothetical protein